MKMKYFYKHLILVFIEILHCSEIAMKYSDYKRFERSYKCSLSKENMKKYYVCLYPIFKDNRHTKKLTPKFKYFIIDHIPVDVISSGNTSSKYPFNQENHETFSSEGNKNNDVCTINIPSINNNWENHINSFQDKSDDENLSLKNCDSDSWHTCVQEYDENVFPDNIIDTTKSISSLSKKKFSFKNYKINFGRVKRYENKSTDKITSSEAFDPKIRYKIPNSILNRLYESFNDDRKRDLIDMSINVANRHSLQRFVLDEKEIAKLLELLDDHFTFLRRILFF